MSQTSLDPVRVALARHLNVDPEAVLPVHDLRADLKLYSLDLVLIALGLEREGGSEFPIAWLDTVRTVAELSAITVAWMDRGRRSRHARRPCRVRDAEGGAKTGA
jgi:acyl carrier protein